ncbi:hypothetical protein F183_A34330 [Bryobacterales bacterium F-183]|nr:hypothetical protein F183_A34330 [Bryobacterales bacterium F-183]
MRLFLFVLAFAISSLAQPQAHIPEAKVFRTHLERDLRAYFADTLQRADLARVDFEEIRSSGNPTQTGTALPKFYYWVRVYDLKRTKVAEGAVRAAAIERKRFEITHFIARRRVRSEPELLQKIFPPLLHEPIYRLAEGR